MNLNFNNDSFVEKIVVDCETHAKLNFFEDFDTIDNYVDIIARLEEMQKKYSVIIVDINSVGGNVATLIHIMNVIRKFELVITINSAEALSAGFILWCLGDIRIAYPHSSFMWHRESWGMFDKTNAQKRYAEHCQHIYDVQIRPIVSEVLTEDELKFGEETEYWILGQTLIDRGVATNPEDFDISEIFNNNHAQAVVSNMFVITHSGYRTYDVYIKKNLFQGIDFKQATMLLLAEKGLLNMSLQEMLCLEEECEEYEEYEECEECADVNEQEDAQKQCESEE